MSNNKEEEKHPWMAPTPLAFLRKASSSSSYNKNHSGNKKGWFSGGSKRSSSLEQAEKDLHQEDNGLYQSSLQNFVTFSPPTSRRAIQSQTSSNSNSANKEEQEGDVDDAEEDTSTTNSWIREFNNGQKKQPADAEDASTTNSWIQEFEGRTRKQQPDASSSLKNSSSTAGRTSDASKKASEFDDFSDLDDIDPVWSRNPDKAYFYCMMESNKSLEAKNDDDDDDEDELSDHPSLMTLEPPPQNDHPFSFTATANKSRPPARMTDSVSSHNSTIQTNDEHKQQDRDDESFHDEGSMNYEVQVEDVRIEDMQSSLQDEESLLKYEVQIEGDMQSKISSLPMPLFTTPSDILNREYRHENLSPHQHHLPEQPKFRNTYNEKVPYPQTIFVSPTDSAKISNSFRNGNRRERRWWIILTVLCCTVLLAAVAVVLVFFLADTDLMETSEDEVLESIANGPPALPGGADNTVIESSYSPSSSPSRSFMVPFTESPRKTSVPFEQTSSPSVEPSTMPSAVPSFMPSMAPSSGPSMDISEAPSAAPTNPPSVRWSIDLTTSTTTAAPSGMPSLRPTASMPSSQPSSMPSLRPTRTPVAPPTQAPVTLPPTRAPVAATPAPVTAPPTQEPAPTIPQVIFVSNDGGPGSLGRCQGDCDSDEQCTSDLVCLQRGAGQPVPGCLGGEEDASATDYCVDRSFLPPTPPPTTAPLITFLGDSPPGILGNCQGDCDTDDQCFGSLVCFQRDASEAVPGCLGGEQSADFTDYCVDPSLVAPAPPPTTSQPVQPVPPPGASNPQPVPLPPTAPPTPGPPVAFVGNPGPGLLGLCQGDCDEDEECSGSLVCFQRILPNEAVPGCQGGELDETGNDYCIDPLVLSGASAAAANGNVTSTNAPTLPPTPPPTLRPTPQPTRPPVGIKPTWPPNYVP